ncbi:MAG: hypothetical protein ACI9YM_000159 [Brevundimonas sp.]|jgi:hypothetical protein|uniref:DUF2975 domain-containing protein n=1 Tax=Brevundimonas sp. TaxID=1871086 RepID=UPI00248726B6|nr:DUF2975 domain-containing protein [Brevundimonas sp.]MDI1280387.1 DUF2975 domain-containing protein [Brevundimonas sp.]
MRRPTIASLGSRLPRLTGRSLRAPNLKTLGPGSVSSLLKIALDVAYVLLGIITGGLIIGLVAAVFIPFADLNLTVTDDSGGLQQPLTRPLLLFGVGAFAAFFGSFMLILRNLRMIFRTLTLGDPFQPPNVRRLRQIGLILAVVTGGKWLAQGLVADRLAPGIMDPQGFTDLLTPVFSVLVVFVLAEVFREGARLRRESELTI